MFSTRSVACGFLLTLAAVGSACGGSGGTGAGNGRSESLATCLRDNGATSVIQTGNYQWAATFKDVGVLHFSYKTVGAVTGGGFSGAPALRRIYLRCAEQPQS